MSASSQDPRTTDSVSRYALPYPLAALYRLAHASHEASARFGFALRLAEGVFRFLALTNLADAAACGDVSPKKLNEWFGMLQTPGMGKLLGLFRSTTEHLTAGAAPFVPEARDLLADDWQKPADEVVRMRNRWTHDEVQVTNLEAGPLLEELAPSLRALLSGIQFLGRYRLGTTQALRSVGSSFTYYWYSSRGLEETCEPVSLRGQTPVSDNLVLLLHPQRGEGLYLAPFFFWGLTQGDRAAHLAWLHGLETNPAGERIGRYRHPVLRQDVVRGLPDPADPDGKGVTLERYLARRGDWPGRARLQLTADSVAKLTDPLYPPKTEERFQVIGKLGEGGMGTVWEVEDTLLNCRRALKVLHGDFVRSPQAVRRFLREGKVLAQISHPAVVEVFDVGIGHDQVPYLVMALVQGEDLEHRVARAGPVPLDEAVALMLDALEAIGAIHQAGVVHRDVKPSNLILTEDGVKVVDFGIAAMPDGTRLTQAMDRMGTAQYMAPEQWNGEFSPRSDLYACGRVLFALLAGRPPKTAGEKLTGAAPGTPRTVEQVYEQATAEDPEARFASARAMAEALEAALELANQPEPARPPGPPAVGRSESLEIFQRAERLYPQPIARAVRNMAVTGRNPGSPGGLWALFTSFEVVLQYLVASAAAQVDRRANPAAQEKLRQIYSGRVTLGLWAAVLRDLAHDLPGEPGLEELFRAGPVDHLITVRNQVAHSESIAPPDPGRVLRDVVPAFADLLARLSFLERRVLYVGGLEPWWEPGLTGRATEAMGALPSAWVTVPLQVPRPGLYVRTPGGLASLYPLARLGERPDDVLLFCGARRDVPEFLSTLSGERISEKNSELTEDLRRACFVRGGGGPSPRPPMPKG